ncbi:MAG: VOC family protein [Thermoguttaceae bacterium]
MPGSPIPQSRLATFPAPGSFHHVGFVVASIVEIGQGFASSIGVQWNREIIHDPRQQARVTFLRSSRSNDPAIELVEPDGDKSPLHKFLASGGGLHHVCYEVDCVSTQLEQSRAAGCLIVKQPLPAAAFGGRLIGWVYSPQKLLIEYLERDRGSR